MPKRYCTSRAEWRLQPGKPAEPLSPHYRLDCDFGTGVITCWEEGGSEPIYVCESHAKQLGRPRERVTDVRIVASPAEGSVRAAVEDQTELQEVAAASPHAASREAARTFPNTQVELAADRTAVQEIADPAPSVTASPEPPPSRPVTIAAEPVVEPAEIQEVAPPEPKAPAPADPPARVPAEVKVARVAEPSAKPAARDLTYGDPARAMVDEAIWNLATGNYKAYKAALEQGKSITEAAEAAGGQFAMVHRKIGDYRMRLENLFSESKGAISLAESIDKPLDQAVLDVIANGTMTDPEKDAAVQQLGVIQEWAKHGLQGNIAPLQANQILVAIGDRLNWGGAAGVPEEFKSIYRALFGNLKAAVRAAVPEAQNLHDRLINLYAAKSDLEVRYFRG